MNLIIIPTSIEEACSRGCFNFVFTRLLFASRTSGSSRRGSTATTRPAGNLGEFLFTSSEDFGKVLACHLIDEIIQTLLSIAVELDVHGRKDFLAVRNGGGGVSADNRQHVSSNNFHVFKHKTACCLGDLESPC